MSNLQPNLGMYKLKTFLLLLLLHQSVTAQLLPQYGASRSGTVGMQFLKIGIDARSAAMAGNTIASINDVSALYWNPAGLTRLDTQKFHFQGGHTAYFAGIGLNYVGAAMRNKSGGVWGVSLISLNSGDMPVTTEFQPNGTGETFSFNSTSLGLSFAKALTDNFSFGITGKYAREGVAGLVTNNAIFDLGFQYDVGYANTRFAVTVSNFGFNVKPNGTLQWLSLQGKQTLNDFEEVAVPAIFRIGFAWDPIKSENHLLTLTTQLNHPTDRNESFGLAAEYCWNNTFFARSGYEFGVDEAVMPAFGAGVQFKRNFGLLRLDYGFNNKSRLGNTHRFTLGLSVF